MMPDNKRFYWIKLKTTFFDEEAIDFLMSQENGSKYVVIYLMLCLQAIKNNSKSAIPYDTKEIAKSTKYFGVDTVVVAIELFKRLGMVREENQALHIINLDEMIKEQ